jgi:hypothetical protein
MEINGYKINYSEADLYKKVNEETLDIELVSKDFEEYKGLSEGDKKALEHLVFAAQIMNNVSLEQDHPLNMKMKKALENAAKDSSYAELALKLFNSLNGISGFNGVDKEPVEIFEGIKFLKGHNFYPQDMSIAEFHNILLNMLKQGKIDEVKDILNTRTMVRRHGDGLRAVDYTEYFANEFSVIANELEAAAHYSTNAAFNEYLGWQAQALIQNNPEMDMLADKHWAELQDTPLEFTISRENYDDEITPTVYDNEALTEELIKHNIEVVSKDMLGVRVGIINKKGTDLILKFKEHMPELAKLMPYADMYRQPVLDGKELKQTMVDADIVDLEGDYAQCRGGITTAQNLPNNDKLSVKTGGGRRNVYHKQVRQSGDKAKEQKILDILVDKSLHKYYDKEADHLFVIGHENGHSLGPDSSYQNALGTYKHIMEEHKADVISLAFMPHYAKNKIIDEEMLKKIYVSYIAGRMFLIAQPHNMLPHRVAELIQFNYLLENKVIEFNAAGKLTINFETIGRVFIQLLNDTVEVQLSKSPRVAEEFINKYSVWSEVSQKIAQIRQEFGIKPYKRIVRYF